MYSDHSILLPVEFNTISNSIIVYFQFSSLRSELCKGKDHIYLIYHGAPQNPEQDQRQSKHLISIFQINKWPYCVSNSARFWRGDTKTIKTQSLSLSSWQLSGLLLKLTRAKLLRVCAALTAALLVSLPKDNRQPIFSSAFHPSAWPAGKHVLAQSSPHLGFSTFPELNTLSSILSPFSNSTPTFFSIISISPRKFLLFLGTFLQHVSLISPLIMRCRISLVTSFKNVLPNSFLTT